MRTSVSLDRLRPAIGTVLAVLLLLVLTPAKAVVTGGDVWSIITGQAAALAEVGYAVVKGDAWAYGYAAVLWNEQEAWDITGIGNPDLAYVDVSRSMGWIGRARAIGWARQSTGEIYVNTSRKRAGVAKAYAGIGTTYKTAGSTGGWLVSKILNIILDPTSPVTPDRFDYSVRLVDPEGNAVQLLDVHGAMLYDPGANDWHLSLYDSSGTLNPGMFTKTVNQTVEGKQVIFSLNNAIEYRLFLSTPWGDDKEFTIITQIGCQPVPEPSTVILFLTGVLPAVGGSVRWWGGVKQMPK